MNTATQISGNIRPNNKALHALKSMLFQLGIQVTHAGSDELFFYDADEDIVWQKYNSELAFYESIANSAFHIIYNDEAIDEGIASEILYALIKNRPILMTGAPAFADDLSPFMRDIIIRHLPQFHSINLPELELTEIDVLLRKLETTNYHLTSSEKIHINNRIKMHFRTLLDEAKKLHISKVRSNVRPIKEN